MALDTTLLQVLKHRKRYDQLHRSVNARAIDARTKVVLADFGKYFAQVEDCETIPVKGEFLTWFSMVAHRGLTEDDLIIYRKLFDEIAKEPSEDTQRMLVQSLLESDLAVKLSDALQSYNDEDEIDLPSHLRNAMESFEMDVDRKIKLPVVEVDDSLFDDDTNDTGFSWRWECMNRVMRRLRPGDFGILAGRPDKGKSTAIADNITYMAPQIASVYGEEHGRTIVWLNNEGPGERIFKRVIQSALGLPTSELVKLQKDSQLWPSYTKAVGNLHAIKVFNIHGMKSWQVEEILRQCKPALVVMDMVDNISFDSSVINGGTRTDQLLEGMYQWSRELAVRFHCPVIATSQISNEGDGLPYPTLPMLKDSKTGKQGAADFIITIGAKNEPGFENIRFIGMTKNKLRLEGQPQSPKAELLLDGAAGRYLEPRE